MRSCMELLGHTKPGRFKGLLLSALAQDWEQQPSH
jgi:hypothetical protein